MGLLSDIWQKIKQAGRQPRPIVYATDAKGKEIKFKPTAPKAPPHTKHAASKHGFSHAKKASTIKRSSPFTNHQRVVMGRANKMGITIASYNKQFC